MKSPALTGEQKPKFKVFKQSINIKKLALNQYYSPDLSRTE